MSCLDIHSLVRSFCHRYGWHWIRLSAWSRNHGLPYRMFARPFPSLAGAHTLLLVQQSGSQQSQRCHDLHVSRYVMRRSLSESFDRKLHRRSPIDGATLSSLPGSLNLGGNMSVSSIRTCSASSSQILINPPTFSSPSDRSDGTPKAWAQSTRAERLLPCTSSPQLRVHTLPFILMWLLETSFRYSYSKTKGLFGGVSIEGSVIVERQEYVWSPRLFSSP
jgi:hypothetical protein